jgi:hypothetical protein
MRTIKFKAVLIYLTICKSELCELLLIELFLVLYSKNIPSIVKLVFLPDVKC